MMRSARLIRFLVPVLLGSCVYYNGMYNANRLAGSARKAERDGRTFDANNLWAQVATKAESVITRHPTSKYAEEANVLRGVALARLGQCEAALVPLSRAILMPPSDLTEDALLATGRCQFALGNVSASQTAFGFLLDSKNRDRRDEARFQMGRALRQQGRYDDALRSLDGVKHPRAEDERVLALAGAGRRSQAMALADSLLARGDSTRPWDSLVVAMGSQSPADASRLLDRVQALSGRSPEVRARQLLEDGIRLSRSDPARARERFHRAIDLSGTRAAAGRASLQLALMDLQRISRPEELAAILENLRKVTTSYETVADESARLITLVEGVNDAARRVTWETPRGDLRLFLAAEMARDSLEAPMLAANLFRRILDDFPNSSYGAKVVLAAQRLDSTWADSARALLDGRYSESAYLAVIRGQDPGEYRLLEDSLGAFSASLSARKPRPDLRRPSPNRDIDVPKRPPPAPGTSRVPEQ
jgi:tetratricopeptide (TPR) repeat protein